MPFVKRSATGNTSSSSNTPMIGVKPSVHNGQLLISSGLHDLDALVGGGFPIHTVSTFVEDANSQYCNKYLLRYFISEGIACGEQHVTICIGQSSVDQFKQSLPFHYYLLTKEQQEKEKELLEQKKKKQNVMSSDELRIAWRYKDFVDEQIALKQKRMQSIHYKPSSTTTPSKKTEIATGSVLCHEFDFSKSIQNEVWEKSYNSNLFYINLSDMLLESSDDQSLLDSIWTQVKQITDKFSNKVYRIVMESFGNLVYNVPIPSLQEFIYKLRVFARKSQSCCFVSIPSLTPFHNSSQVKHPLMESICNDTDFLFTLYSFVGSHINASDFEFQNCTGLFEIKKMARLHSLVWNYSPQSLQYAFQIKKRKLYIETLHMAPEETRQASNPERPKYSQQQNKTITEIDF